MKVIAKYVTVEAVKDKQVLTCCFWTGTASATVWKSSRHTA